VFVSKALAKLLPASDHSAMGGAPSQKLRSGPFLSVAALVATTACSGTVGGDDSGAGARSSGGTSAGTAGSSGASGNSGNGGSSGISGSGGVGTAPNALGSKVRRLTRAELDDTVRDALGDETAPASRFLAEDEFAPFDNDYTLQRASRALVDSLEAFADDAATRAVDATHRARNVPCTPAGAGDTACFTQTIQTLGRRLFRRTLTSAEVAPYLSLQAFATEDNPYVENDFYTGVSLVIRSMLQDPEFLYRIEVGTPAPEAGTFALDGNEIATRLAFLLWGRNPDDALLDAAEAGALADGAARRAQAERLLADDRAKNAIHRFHAMWLGYRAIPGTPALIASFDKETSRLIDRAVFDGADGYLSLFTSPDTFLDASLAEHYGLPAPAGGEGWVPYGASGRGGILSHGSVLAAFSKFSDTSPTQRGIFVQTRLLCNTVEPAPASVNVDQAPESPDSECKVDRYAAHREASSSCEGCHFQLDSIGFGLEAYDITGRFRTHDDGHEDCPITGDGELPDVAPFNGPGELGRLLVETGEVEHCFVEHLVRYALGRAVKPEEAGVVTALAEAFRSQNYDAKALLLDFVASERFALRREEPPE
jgi:hypothetical protein